MIMAHHLWLCFHFVLVHVISSEELFILTEFRVAMTVPAPCSWVAVYRPALRRVAGVVSCSRITCAAGGGRDMRLIKHLYTLTETRAWEGCCCCYRWQRGGSASAFSHPPVVA